MATHGKDKENHFREYIDIKIYLILSEVIL